MLQLLWWREWRHQHRRPERVGRLSLDDEVTHLRCLVLKMKRRQDGRSARWKYGSRGAVTPAQGFSPYQRSPIIPKSCKNMSSMRRCCPVDSLSAPDEEPPKFPSVNGNTNRSLTLVDNANIIEHGPPRRKECTVQGYL